MKLLEKHWTERFCVPDMWTRFFLAFAQIEHIDHERLSVESDEPKGIVTVTVAGGDISMLFRLRDMAEFIVPMGATLVVRGLQ